MLFTFSERMIRKSIKFGILIGLLLSGCTPTGPVLDETGKVHSPGGNWTVELLDAPPGLTVKDRLERQHPDAKEFRKLTGISITTEWVSPSDWTNFPGAFVYFDEKDRIWAWNGSERTFFAQRDDDGEGSWTVSVWPEVIPHEVRERLPPGFSP